jgi:hypothetical protein
MMRQQLDNACGNTVSTNVGATASSQIVQGNTRRAACIFGGDTTYSCSQRGIDINTSNIVSANAR